MPAELKGKKSKGLGIKKASGLKRTRTGCAECRRRRCKCDETKPTCSTCVKANTECLYPLDLPKEVLFQPYDRQQQQIGSTSYLAPPTPTTAASSSRASPSVATLCTLEWGGLEDRSKMFKTPPGLLESAYPDPEERHLMSHFISFLHKLIFMPYPNPPTPVDGKDDDPFACSLSNVMPQLDIVAFLSNRHQSTTAEEALSLSILAVGAVLLSYLHQEAATTLLFDYPEDPSLAQRSMDAHERYSEVSESLVDASLALIRSSMLLAGNKRQRSLELNQLEADDADPALILMSLAIDNNLLTRCLAGGGNFSEALILAKTLIGMQGGPIKMLQRAQRTGEVKKIRQARVVLEEMVIWETLACLSTGREPDFVFPSRLGHSPRPSGGEPSPSIASWYIAYAPPAGTPRVGTGDGDYETVEGYLGISRGLVEILHRINILYARSRPPSWSALDPTADYPLSIEPTYLAEAHGLLVEINIYKSSFAMSKPVEEMARLELGNLVYLDAMEMMLRLDLLSNAPSQPEVQIRAKEIVTLVLRCFESNGFVLGFMWPLVISASCSTTDEERSRVRDALQTLRSVCCFDLHSAWVLLDRVWEKRDAGDAWASWRSVTGEGRGLLLF